MRKRINFAINIDLEDGTPCTKYSGIYPSEAFKAPQDVVREIVSFLNEEFDLHLVVKVDKKKIMQELIP